MSPSPPLFFGVGRGGGNAIPDHLRITRIGPVVTVTMARPEVHNAYTSQLIASLRASPEGRGGVAASLEKRKPNWAAE